MSQSPQPAQPWQPNPEGLAQILAVLRETTNPQSQPFVQSSIQTFSAHAEWGQYLAHIMARCKTEPEHVREVAGLLLKHHLSPDQFKCLPVEWLRNIKEAVLVSLYEPQPLLRRTAAILVSTILKNGTLQGWPEALPQLVAGVMSTDMTVVDGALYALTLVCEDQTRVLDSQATGRPLAHLIPKFLEFFKSPQEPFRMYAVTCMYEFILEMPGSLVDNIENFVQGLFYLSRDPSWRVRQKVCRSFVTLTEVHFDMVAAHMGSIIQLMAQAMSDTEETVSIEACEFWQAVASGGDVSRELIRPYLPNIVPMLLERMVYDEADIAVYEQEEKDTLAGLRQHTADKDIRPQLGGSSGGAKRGDMDDEDEAGDDDDDDAYNEPSEWNIRKCSAAGLDVIAGVFGDDLLPHLLPHVQAKLNAEWHVQESAILALGAVAEGCTGMQQHLPSLVPFLVNFLQHPKAMVRSITCWTLSRYAKWIVSTATAPQVPGAPHPHEAFFKPVLSSILERIHDPFRKVQEAACSAFATIEEEAAGELVPYLQPILQSLMRAFTTYESKNLLILYDAISTLADSVGPELAKEQYIVVLMPPLVAKYNDIGDDDTKLFPLLECLTSIASALGVAFQPYAHPIFARCLRLIETTLVQHAAFTTDHTTTPEYEFIVYSLDLISGIADGLSHGIESLVAGSNVVPLLAQCCTLQAQDVRQSAFALVGDLAKTAFPHLAPSLPAIVPLLSMNIRPEYTSVCNNASWAIGEIAVRWCDPMKAFVPDVMQHLVAIVNQPRAYLHRNLMDNASICLGRLCLVASDIIAPHIGSFIANWCLSLKTIRDDKEKEEAYRGLVEAIKKNPNAVIDSFQIVCQAFVSWQTPPSGDLGQQMGIVVHGFKNALGPRWPQFYASFPENLKMELQRSAWPAVLAHLGCLDLLAVSLVSRGMRAAAEAVLAKRMSDFGLASPCCVGSRCTHALSVMSSFPARRLCCGCATNLCWKFGMRRRWNAFLPWFQLCPSCYLTLLPRRIEAEGGVQAFKAKLQQSVVNVLAIYKRPDVCGMLTDANFSLIGIGELGGLEVILAVLNELLGGKRIDQAEVPARYRDAYTFIYPHTADIWGHGEKLPELSGLLAAMAIAMEKLETCKAQKRQQTLTLLIKDLGQELVSASSCQPVDNVVSAGGGTGGSESIS
eukprot:m51a1_g7037 putative transportin-1-like isoform x1 (1172) ;mRNA; f:95930-102268